MIFNHTILYVKSQLLRMPDAFQKISLKQKTPFESWEVDRLPFGHYLIISGFGSLNLVSLPPETAPM